MIKFRFLVLCLLILSLSSCFTNRMFIKNEFQEHEGIEYLLTKVAENWFTNNYGDNSYVTVKDKETGATGRFYLVEIEIKNTSDEKKEINLAKLKLCDKSGFCLLPSRIDVKSFVDIPSYSILILNPHETQGRQLFYPGSKEFIPEYVLIDETENIYIEFEYLKNN